VDRLHGKTAVCKSGRYALVASCFPHFGEEDCLRGWNGSGTIFFSWCNLRAFFVRTPTSARRVRGSQPPPSGWRR
jgi:putative pyruvate formate lyase activating enzyme